VGVFPGDAHARDDLLLAEVEGQVLVVGKGAAPAGSVIVVDRFLGRQIAAFGAAGVDGDRRQRRLCRGHLGGGACHAAGLRAAVAAGTAGGEQYCKAGQQARGNQACGARPVRDRAGAARGNAGISMPVGHGVLR
jgi:hypothetical protein